LVGNAVAVVAKGRKTGFAATAGDAGMGGFAGHVEEQKRVGGIETNAIPVRCRGEHAMSLERGERGTVASQSAISHAPFFEGGGATGPRIHRRGCEGLVGEPTRSDFLVRSGLGEGFFPQAETIEGSEEGRLVALGMFAEEAHAHHPGGVVSHGAVEVAPAHREGG
jgi:hypothetical protein